MHQSEDAEQGEKAAGHGSAIHRAAPQSFQVREA
jgi:hypothetical protein